MPESKTAKEKEREEKFKALREELEAQIEADLEASSLRARQGSVAGEAISEIALPAGRQASAPQDDTVTPKRIVEALLFASGKPMTAKEIQKIAGAASAKEIEALVGELREEYQREGRSFEVIEIAGGFEIVTRKEYAVWLARLELQRKVRQATRSALETIAILAYKQPVTRAEIEELRGVDVSGVLSTLLEKGFIKIVGKKEVAGRPFLYGTTDKFLEHFGLKSIKDLPDIGEIKGLVERAVRKEELIGERRGAVSAPEGITLQGGETPPLQTEP